MVREVESYARAHPAVFLGAAVAAGFLAVRFLKSSGEAAEAPVDRRTFDSGPPDSVPERRQLH
jgi:hypothetical protein